jgi:rhodanese-related sulfurtransferase
MFGGPRIPEIGVAELPDGAFILDVREDDEWQAGRIDGAVHVPLMTVPDRLGEIPQDRPVVVVCRVGGRSAQATHYLIQAGHDAVNLGGGMMAWAAAGRPMIGDGPDPYVV